MPLRVAPLRVPYRVSRLQSFRPLTTTYARYGSSQTHQYKPLPEPEVFNKTSRPGLYYSRPSPKDLPPLQNKWPAILALGALGVSAWGLFMVFVTNQEKLSSSIMQQIMNTVTENPELREVLGEAIRPEPVWWMNGDPWIDGAIHIPGGNIDLSFRVKGHKGAGTLYFTSIRRVKGEPFQILRFKVIADDGTEVNISPSR
ncbi:DUF1783-domain-containing protein [Lentinus tigrinus ALCF2SS1-7]|uniref:DUF1783-domain-containing protein n=1 Tax=Lentinus tigrinus ALCF2SS1-6 TaxID=1328759 RepID=A0A5C2SRM2_9APHY|nr:DUF1783-domain-containing protein [Lentinus tigrinus ALCF2SS1-6]RPD80442.1 DUF1783-domain-containing protein [Lentinus tigrinus ALCF2SS1-7]